MKKIALIGTAWALPLLAFAQTRTIFDAGDLALRIVNQVVVPVVFALTFIVFIWGVLQYFISANNDEKRDQGKKFMLYGIIGFAVMLSVWGLVGLLINTLNLNQAPLLPPPTPSR